MKEDEALITFSDPESVESAHFFNDHETDGAKLKVEQANESDFSGSSGHSEFEFM